MARLVPTTFVLIWSTGYIVAGIVIPLADPLTFLSARYAIAFALLAPVCFALGARWPATRSAWLHALLSGALLHGMYQGGVWWAIQHGVPAGVSALIAALQPLFTALAAGPMVGERLGPVRWSGVALGFLGVAAVVAPKLDSAEAIAQLGWPVALNVLAMVAVTGATLHQKRWLAGVDLKSLAPIQFFGAIAVTLPFALLLESGRFDVVAETIAGMAWAVLVLSIAAALMMMAMVERGEVSRVAALIYLVPPVAAVQAYLLLGETLNALQIAGMALAAVGVFLANRSAAPARARGRA